MKEVIRKTLFDALDRTVKILETKEAKDVEELQSLSEEVIEEVAVYKDLDIVSLTVLIYSIYKVIITIPDKDYDVILAELRFARKHLQKNDLGKYNKSIKDLYNLVRKCDAKVKVHLQDVMHAAKIKKSASLLKKGLSIGQAAGLMGLSNWDLQQYVGKTTFMDQHTERKSAINRLKMAMRVFSVGSSK